MMITQLQQKKNEDIALAVYAVISDSKTITECKEFLQETRKNDSKNKE